MLRALHCDLIVAAHPKPADLPSGWSAERLLLATGIPVLMIPAGWGGETIGENVMIAWNRSREARRAVNDAIPFINSARSEEHTSELQSLMRISYAVFCLKKKKYKLT